MALAIDASTPARWTNAVVDGVNSTSASFTAPSGALLVLCIGLDTGDNPANVTLSVSDSGGLTWTERVHSDKDHPTANGNGGSCAIWTAVTSSSVARTVSVQYSPNLTDNRDLSCKLYVVTGQSPSPIGASGRSNTETGNAPTLSLFTSTAANSLGFVAVSDWAASGIPTSSDLTFTGDEFQHASFFTVASGYKNLGTVGAETASLDFPGTAATTLTWGALEIKDASASVSLTASNLTLGAKTIGAPALGVSTSPPVFRSGSSTTYAVRTNTTVTAPSGIANNDILIAAMFIAGATTAPVPTPPSGFTQIGVATTVTDEGGFNGRLYVWYKRASSESGDYTFNHVGASTQAFIAAYSGCITSGSPVDVFSENGYNGSDGQVTTALSVTTTVVNDKLLYIMHDWTGSGALSPPTGFTERFDGLLYYADANQAAAGASGDKTQTNGNPGTFYPWASFLIALMPSGSGAAGTFSPVNLTTGAPTIPAASMAVKYGFTPASLTVSVPTLGSATFTKLLTASSVTVSSPTLGAPSLVKTVPSANLSLPAPTIGAPGLFPVAPFSVHDRALDFGLTAIAGATALHIMDRSASNYANVLSFSLGNAMPLFVGPVAGSPGGRKITMTGLIGGTITTSGRAVCWALVDTPNSRVLASGPLSGAVTLSAGNTFGIDAIPIRYPG